MIAPKLPPPPADRPEQIGLGLGVRAHEAAVRGDHVGREDAVAGEAVAAGEPPDAPAQRVSDDPHVRGGARERGQPVLRRGTGDVAPPGARLDARPGSVGVELDPAHAARPQEDGVLERGDGGGVVAGALDGDAHPAPAGEPHGGLDVLRRLGEGHRGRVLVGCEVPRPPGVVLLRTLGGDELARELFGEGVQLARRGHRGSSGG
ncbi:MAG TPA: hypothetical protein VK387_00870 [Thermoleophilaceae bacterium]|nr:hypothetical protein [Thermoleophilaceae bacterium]